MYHRKTDLYFQVADTPGTTYRVARHDMVNTRAQPGQRQTRQSSKKDGGNKVATARNVIDNQLLMYEISIFASTNIGKILIFLERILSLYYRLKFTETALHCLKALETLHIFQLTQTDVCVH